MGCINFDQRSKKSNGIRLSYSAVVQDVESGEVLMLAYMNEER
jgi:phosphoribosyl-AMP cyclohydrolase